MSSWFNVFFGIQNQKPILFRIECGFFKQQMLRILIWKQKAGYVFLQIAGKLQYKYRIIAQEKHPCVDWQSTFTESKIRIMSIGSEF